MLTIIDWCGQISIIMSKVMHSDTLNSNRFEEFAVSIWLVERVLMEVITTSIGMTLIVYVCLEKP